MNTLEYAILSALGRKPCSGYELAAYLELLWPAKHSQIYPHLTKLEQKGLLVYEHVEQLGKPDKKVYSITDEGKEALKAWIVEQPAEPALRDEFLIKINAMWLADEDGAKKLLYDRISALGKKVEQREKKIAKVEKEHKETGPAAGSKHFGRYILLNRRNMLDREEISWCQWVLGLFGDSKLVKLMLGVVGAEALVGMFQGMEFFG
ncbi:MULTISPECIES: PadR family transcriptional regulator [Paenibacillus]|uniref:Transcriptional regulator n=1 Tax=Paenibacillus albilobatus TaxID=2716884 RepID=A0A919XCF4_9BACL|nr:MULTISPECIES: PadR family transcriptional regulator [Paenibacillus]GIO30092.1 transcriptional regulator [Paenibacillus albilobatus]